MGMYVANRQKLISALAMAFCVLVISMSHVANAGDDSAGGDEGDDIDVCHSLSLEF